MRRVLVGFSGSDESRDALHLARAFSCATDAELIVACIYAEGPMLEGTSLYAPIPADWESPGERRERFARTQVAFAEAQQELGEARFVRADGLGSPARELQRIAREQAADLTVIGSTHRGWMGRIHPGSVARRIMNGSPCAVAIAPRGYASAEKHTLETIGVAYDGSPESKLALDQAHVLAAAGGGRLRLIAAVAPEMPNLLVSMHTSIVKKQVERGLRATAAEIDDVEVEVRVIEADPAIALEHEGTDLDLLVVGSRGYGPLRSVLLGSVSEALVSTAPCPVLVTPRGSGRAGGAPERPSSGLTYQTAGDESRRSVR